MSTELTTAFNSIIGQPESDQLEYKAVLPPSRTIAQIISSFANTNGGYLILGVTNSHNKIEVKGLSEDFQSISITKKSLELLSPVPQVEYEYFMNQGRKLFGIKINKSTELIVVENKVYKRVGAHSVLQNPIDLKLSKTSYAKIGTLHTELKAFNLSGTNAKHKLIEHYQNILKIIDDVSHKLYPTSPLIPSNIAEGKILSRIIFSSFVDNFESYLSDLLYEIYLARPETLKSKQQVTIEEILNCTDMTDFVKYWAKQKLNKLQRGSVRGFIRENKQIEDLKVLDEKNQTEIECILQIRHLYAHRNGIIDEKFVSYFPSAALNAEHAVSVDQICETLLYLAKICNSLDDAAIKKYDLAQI